jgi:hypothetical protein
MGLSQLQPGFQKGKRVLASVMRCKAELLLVLALYRSNSGFTLWNKRFAISLW